MKAKMLWFTSLSTMGTWNWGNVVRGDRRLYIFSKKKYIYIYKHLYFKIWLKMSGRMLNKKTPLGTIRYLKGANANTGALRCWKHAIRSHPATVAHTLYNLGVLELHGFGWILNLAPDPSKSCFSSHWTRTGKKGKIRASTCSGDVSYWRITQKEDRVEVQHAQQGQVFNIDSALTLGFSRFFSFFFGRFGCPSWAQWQTSRCIPLERQRSLLDAYALNINVTLWNIHVVDMHY